MKKTRKYTCYISSHGEDFAHINFRAVDDNTAKMMATKKLNEARKKHNMPIKHHQKPVYVIHRYGLCFAVKKSTWQGRYGFIMNRGWDSI